MAQLTYFQALRRAIREEMARDERVVVIGEDIAYHGGPYGVTAGLVQEFGIERLIETPITESQFVDAAVGMALTGLRPIVDFMVADNMLLAHDQIIHACGQYPHIFGVELPVVLRGPVGGGLRFLPSHEKSIESFFLNCPGLKIVYPSTALDTYGLLKSAVRDNYPVLFLEHKMFYFHSITGEFGDAEFTIPIGKADVKRKGKDVSIIAWGMMADRSLKAAQQLAQEGIDAEVVDLRTLRPLDRQTVLDSVRKTQRALVVQEAPKFGGFAGELAATIMEHAFDYLDAPVMRLAGPEIPIPWSPRSQDWYLVDQQKICKAVKELLGRG